MLSLYDGICTRRPSDIALCTAVTSLPDSVGLLSLRQLAWPMARLLSEGVRLNLMSLEALASSEQLGAELCLATADENLPLLAAAGARAAPLRLIG